MFIIDTDCEFLYLASHMHLKAQQINRGIITVYMADSKLSMSTSEYYVKDSPTERVVFASRDLSNDTDPGIKNSLTEENCLIKQPVTQDIILRCSQYLKPKCRMRKISSKAAVLVLIWTFLINCAFQSLSNFFNTV